MSPLIQALTDDQRVELPCWQNSADFIGEPKLTDAQVERAIYKCLHLCPQLEWCRRERTRYLNEHGKRAVGGTVMAGVLHSG